MRKLSLLVVFMMAFFMLVACSSDSAEPGADGAEETYETLVVGYAQIGAESEWRTANTASIKETAQQLGVTLKFSDAQQKQENQIAAIRSYIAEGVDVIGFSPVVETGWETVLQEAKDAGIPVIMVDRRADVPRELYATYLGSDFVEEGRKAGNEMNRLLPSGGKIVRPTTATPVSVKPWPATSKLSIPNPATSPAPWAKK